MRENGQDEAAIESFMLAQLGVLRAAIKDIALLPAFREDFRQKWMEAFGKPLGEVPVFLRSDTNMEDLKEFTGAGLNLTVFNVVDPEKIFQGIRDVWSSPYTERSYKWRQKYLLNPENVFPSILVIPSVDVDYSGVMITKGITTGEGGDMTIAFSRGAGGAVDGQAAETYLSTADQTLVLLSPAREPLYNRLPETGGTERQTATFDQPVLNDQNMYDLRVIAQEIRQTLPSAPGIETDGPFDIELGFQNNKLWLFQVRPFVENKKAVSSAYLQSITPALPTQNSPLDARLDRNPK
jgi:phosphoenolpyruvate synthase/pyruvate phosphate dikinase